MKTTGLILVAALCAAAAGYAPGEHVKAYFPGYGFIASEVVEARGAEYKVHYRNWSEKYDKWLQADKVKPLPAAEDWKKTAEEIAAEKFADTPPLGEYAVYQMNGPNYSYQYTLKLKDGSHYSVYDEKASNAGTYQYDRPSRTLRFVSGPYANHGWAGTYYTKGRNADGRPTICIREASDKRAIDDAANGAYQYAHYRASGVQ